MRSHIRKNLSLVVLLIFQWSAYVVFISYWVSFLILFLWLIFILGKLSSHLRLCFMPCDFVAHFTMFSFRELISKLLSISFASWLYIVLIFKINSYFSCVVLLIFLSYFMNVIFFTNNFYCRVQFNALVKNALFLEILFPYWSLEYSFMALF